MKENRRAIIINLISNTIFQIAVMVISGSGIIYTIKKGIESANNRTISISATRLCILIISSITITICAIALVSKIFGYKRHKDEQKKFEDVNDYYFTDYEKHITIYRNGNGIIIHRFTVIVNNVDKFRRIRRKLNIEDGNVHSNFPSLEKMMQADKAERFDKFGFWYYDKNNIISEVKEYYWQKNSDEESKKLKCNPKEIRWIFKINKHNVQRNKPYEIIYAVSIPGLAPLENGRLNRELQSEDFGDESSSNMNIDHKIRNLRYIISFEEGVEIETAPQCRYIISGQDEPRETVVAGTKEYDMLYNKYIFQINAPEFNSDVRIMWKYNKIGTV